MKGSRTHFFGKFVSADSVLIFYGVNVHGGNESDLIVGKKLQ
jgi:hypothetical protein